MTETQARYVHVAHTLIATINRQFGTRYTLTEVQPDGVPSLLPEDEQALQEARQRFWHSAEPRTE